MVSRELSAIAVLVADLDRAVHGLDDAFSSVDEELRSRLRGGNGGNCIRDGGAPLL